MCAGIAFTALYVFTDVQYAYRYDYPIIVFAFPLLAIFLCNCRYKRKNKRIFMGLFMLLVGACSIYTYYCTSKIDYNSERINIVKDLVKNNYNEGYATFWNANVLTELSNGKVEVWSWCDNKDEKKNISKVKDINSTYERLQFTSHKVEHPKNKLFLFFTQEEYNMCNWKEDLDKYNIIYESDSYIVFGYDNYEKLISDIKT